MKCYSSILAVVLTITSAAPLLAVEVFNSGGVPDLSDQSNFTYSDNQIFGIPTPPDAFYYRHVIEEGALAAPVTVRSIEFYGYTEWADGLGSSDHGFELSIDGLVNVLDIVRTDVGPTFATDPGVLTTPVQRIQIDISPILFEGSEVLIRGDTGLFADFFMAWADPAIGDITLETYNDPSLSIIDSVTNGAAFHFAFFDEFQTFLLGDANGDGVVDLLDLDILGTNFGLMGSATFAEGDFNGDGNVDLLDLDILGTNFGATSPAAAIPEPTSVLILLSGLVCLRRR